MAEEKKAAEKQSAEKDLLKLIENPGPAAPKKTAEKPADKKAQAKTKTSRKPGVNVAALLTDRRAVIKMLFFAIIAVFAYLLYSIYSESRKLKVAKDFTVFESGHEKTIAPSASPAPATEEILPEAPFRNIFRPKPKKAEEPKADTAAVTTQNYKLVGISMDPDPAESSAMVENVKTNVTFFLKKGDKLEGMELMGIYDDKLVLKVQGQEVELR